MGKGSRSEATFLCDTTVLYAASDAAHRHHEACLARVASAVPSKSFVAAHTLAELRRLDQVLEAVEHAAGVFTPVTRGPQDYLWVVRHVARVGARSEQIYDALIHKCGERAKVDVVYTLNLAHFRNIAWPGMLRRIRIP